MQLVLTPPQYSLEAAAKTAAPRERTTLELRDSVMIITLILGTLYLLRVEPEYRDGAFLVIALFGMAVAIRDFSLIWMFFLAELPIIQLQSELFDQSRVSWTRFLLVGLMIVFVVSKKKAGFWKGLSRQLAFVGLVLFLVANLLSAFRLLEVEAMARCLAYGEPLLVLVMSYHVAISHPDNPQRLLRAILIGGLFVMAMAAFEFTTQKSIIEVLRVRSLVIEDAQSFLLADRYGLGGRITSLFAQPVYAGIGFFAYGLMLAFYVLMYKPALPRIIWILALASGIFLMFVTGSRGPVVALAPTILAFVLFRHSRNLWTRTRNALLILAGVAVVLYTLTTLDLLPGVKEYWTRSFNLTNWESSGLSGRMDLTNTLLDAFMENPILGSGPGMIQKQAMAGSARFAGTAGLENHYAVILADGGLVAAAMYGLFIVGIYVLLIRRLRFESDRATTYYGLMGLLLFTFLFANGLAASFLGGTIIDTMMAVLGITAVGFETWKHQRAANASSGR
jgi:hypothetical protein